MRGVLAALVMVGLATAALAQQKRTDAMKVAEEMGTKWVSVYDKNEPARVTALLAEDGMFMPLWAAFSGRQKIENRLSARSRAYGTRKMSRSLKRIRSATRSGLAANLPWTTEIRNSPDVGWRS
jgi:hypothetical protein